MRVDRGDLSMSAKNRFRPAPSWISWTNVALGIWLVLAAFVFREPSGTGVTENIVAGLFVSLAALWAARAFRPRVSLVASLTVVLTGLWVLAGPFALGYERESAAVANDVIVGGVIIALGAVSVSAKSKRLT
jgi:SPW repeat